MKHKYSLRTKLKTIGIGEQIILFNKRGYRALMRDIGAIQQRDAELANIKYKKAQVIIDDTLEIGVLVYRR